jgi:anhydro-N-acetylmuramic acid kinase
MSGTSADGINVALIKFPKVSSRSPKNRGPSKKRFELLAHSQTRYPPEVRQAVLSMMNAPQASVADLARLNFVLGELYADAIMRTIRQAGVRIELVGCHGQTLYHQGEAANFLGKSVAVTWQTGEGAVIARRVGAPVVSDFRTADMAAGGKGAPLVPFLDYLLYADPRVGRVAQNIGGIANCTVIPAGAKAEQVIAFDTGPGNMVIDTVTDRLTASSYDRDGHLAARGQVVGSVLKWALAAPFFKKKPPKTAGREEFGREFAGEFLRRCAGARKEDVIATATALTARSLAEALRKFVPKKNGRLEELIVSGGGANNPTLMRMIAEQVEGLGLKIRRSDEFGVPSEAKEAVAFALLAFQTWNRLPSNIPSATGAKRGAILGKISYV